MLRHYTATPDTHAIKFVAGKIEKHGRGISFYYLSSLTTILEIPAIAITLPFIFNEATVNFQDVTLQGNVTYRITDPVITSERFDFSRESRYKLAGDGLEKLNQLVINLVQAHARASVCKMALEQVLREVGVLTQAIASSVATDPALSEIGISIETLHFSSARAQPDVQKALQTEYREKIQREADLAIYARRSAAVENEKVIKERELATEIELSNQRKQIVSVQAENTIRIAKADAEAAELKLAAYKGLPPQVLAILAAKEWAEKGGAISNLTITPDMLGELIGKFTKKAA
jgi:hypothetical protein